MRCIAEVKSKLLSRQIFGFRAAGAAAIERLIEPAIEAAGFETVRIRFMGANAQTLQVMVERRDRGQLLVDDCAEISRMVSAILDVEDPVPGAYVLEVSSPGIDRPLVRLGDYERFEGFEARVETTGPVEGRRRFGGRLKGVRGTDVLIECDGTVHGVPFARIRRAALELTDELIEATRRAAEAAGPKEQ